MRNGFLFSTARAAALASIAGAPLVVNADAQPAQAPPANGGPGMVVDSGRECHDIAFLSFLDEFWRDAWKAEFVPHRSGMMLAQTDRDGPRVILVHDGAEIVGKGRYREHVRHHVPGLGHSPDEPQAETSFSFDHFVTAGVVQGPTGYVKPIYGLVQRVALAPDIAASIVVEGITPLGVKDTLDDAVASALEVLGLLAFDRTTIAGNEPPYEPDLDPCVCDEVYFNDLDACLADAVACEASCAAVAIAGILGCLVLGPLAGPCMVAVLAAEALCLAGCLSRQKACMLRARNQWLLCWLECAGSGR